MKRELARQEDRPTFLVIGLNEDEISQIEYEQDEINRLKEELEERDHRIEELELRIEDLTRRHNMEIEELTRRYDAKNEELNSRLVALETLRKHFILTCSVEGKVITIVHCRALLDRHHCMNKDCRARQTLLAEL